MKTFITKKFLSFESGTRAKWQTHSEYYSSNIISWKDLYRNAKLTYKCRRIKQSKMIWVHLLVFMKTNECTSNSCDLSTKLCTCNGIVRWLKDCWLDFRKCRTQMYFGTRIISTRGEELFFLLKIISMCHILKFTVCADWGIKLCVHIHIPFMYNTLLSLLFLKISANATEAFKI